MKMDDKRLAGLLCALMALTAVSCGSTGDSENTEPIGTTGVKETDTALLSGVPAGTDFGGEEIPIWYTTTASSATESLIDIAGELTGDVLDDAIYNANRQVEEKLGVTLDFYNSGVPSGQTGDEVRKLVMADVDDYDLFHSTQWNTAALAAEGLFLNMADAFGQLGYVYREMMQGKNKDIVSMYAARITAAEEKREAFIEKFLSAGN